MNKFLDKIETSIVHSAMCYSSDFMMTPKEGFEQEFEEACDEMALIAKLKEIVKAYYEG